MAGVAGPFALLRRGLDLLLPPACVGCAAEGTLLCEGCAAPLRARLGQPPGAPIGLPVELPAPLLQLEWCAPFTGTTRAALHALKYDGVRDLAETLGAALASRWAEAGRGGNLLVPVPVHPSRLRQRGYDQAALLAEAAGRLLGIPAVAALERVAETSAQHALGRAARARNVGGRFAVAVPEAVHVRGAWAVLVDDVVTTGATLGACGRALLAAGASAVSAVTVAREG